MPDPQRPELARALDLAAHPEGGWYRRTWTAPARLHPEGYPGIRASATAIYFLLAAGEESAWHRVRSDELWLWHRGGPCELLLGGTGQRPAATPHVLTLGPDVETGAMPAALVPADTWQAARPVQHREVLVTCVVSPGFDFADFRLPPDEPLG